MQQACSRCGYISDRPARFCRQCGSQLTVETEASSATTRNYAPQPAQYSEPQSTYPDYAPPRHAEWEQQQTPETNQFYRAPIAAQYPVAAPKPNNWGKWVLISLLTFLILCIIGVGGAIYWGKKFVEQHVGYSPADAPVVAPGNDPSSDAPAEPNAPPRPPGGTSLDSYKYPDAKVTISRKAGVAEEIQMTTEDDLEEVREFYQEKFKNASIKIADDDGKKFVFTTLGQLMTTVVVEPHEKDENKTKITLSRVNLPIPKIPMPKIEITDPLSERKSGGNVR